MVESSFEWEPLLLFPLPLVDLTFRPQRGFFALGHIHREESGRQRRHHQWKEGPALLSLGDGSLAVILSPGAVVQSGPQSSCGEIHLWLCCTESIGTPNGDLSFHRGGTGRIYSSEEEVQHRPSELRMASWPQGKGRHRLILHKREQLY